MFLHVSRRDAWFAPASEAIARLDDLHRHVSAALLERLGLGRVGSLEDPALPICMAPDEIFEHLVPACGLVLLGPSLRRVIVRAEVALLQDQLGADGLRFACEALRWWDAPADPSLPLPLAGEWNARSHAVRLGEALLSCAMAGASAPVAQRGLLRLSTDERPSLPRPLDQASPALDLSLNVLHALEPQWLSSFPARH